MWQLFAGLVYQAEIPRHICFLLYVWPVPQFLEFPRVLPIFFQNQITSLDVFSDNFSILPCLGFFLLFLDVFGSFEDR
jgi:hypothetical protein